MHELVMRRLDLETDLRQAIEADKLEVHYQPIVQAATGRIVGFEALARWNGPDGSPIDPGDFVPIAEETGLIVQLGRRVLERACAQVAEWRGMPGGEGLTLGVNVSHRQLSEPNFPVELSAALASTGLDPRALRLEVREHDLARDTEATRRTLAHVLETLGVRWQIDDFGTGASSLHLLHRFPGDAVKIFGPLVSGMGHDGGSFEIVKAIVELAHNLGLEVIAEGVETAGQLEHLRVLGCEFAQGFHVSAPLAAEDARALLAQGTLSVNG
jgi:EAL domain-containing protein (putative c-di-GMP-specific phosphodiesterase class I)